MTCCRPFLASLSHPGLESIPVGMKMYAKVAFHFDFDVCRLKTFSLAV